MNWQPQPASPKACRREAFSRFVESLSYLESTSGLWDAAIAVSQHALDDLDVEGVRGQLHALAERVENRVRTDSFTARWSRLHEVLFDEDGFCGEVENYYNPVNSYLPVVLQTRRGLPISLCLLYKAVADQLGMEVTGINAPGHFLVRLDDGKNGVLVDPFAGGQILTTEEALTRVRRVVGADCDESCLREASHHDWISRLVRNLQHLFDCSHRMADLEAMNELAAALQTRVS